MFPGMLQVEICGRCNSRWSNRTWRFLLRSFHSPWIGSTSEKILRRKHTNWQKTSPEPVDVIKLPPDGAEAMRYGSCLVAAPGRRAVDEGLAEATLDELLDDPITRALMERDGVEREALRRLMDEVRRRREEDG